MVGRLLIYLGMALIIIGLIILYGGKFNFFGKLPGDFVIRKENFTFYFPLMTSVLLSILLSLIIYIVHRLK